MKFEYELNYDFVNEELSFKITKMPEKYRGRKDITIPVDGENWNFYSAFYPELSYDCRTIYLRGSDKGKDFDVNKLSYDYSEAIDISKALKAFQEWVEEDNDEVVMTVAEIEKKLGIKNLKIVKEH